MINLLKFTFNKKILKNVVNLGYNQFCKFVLIIMMFGWHNIILHMLFAI